MLQLSYSFCISMLHSLWQAALLLLFYNLLVVANKNKIIPYQKRNILFILLATQLFLFFATFSIYFFNVKHIVQQYQYPTIILLNLDVVYYVSKVLFLLYCSILMYKTFIAIYYWVYFKKQFYTGLQKPSVHLKLFTNVQANYWGIKQKIQLWYSNKINTPITFGYFKPIIILPVALINQLSIIEAEMLILHELTHIKANDYYLNWVLLIIENVLFFNPFVFLLCQKARLEREKHCDINVITFGYAPLYYAETLLKTQHFMQQVLQFQLAATSNKKQLLNRIIFFTGKQNKYSKKYNQFITPLFSFFIVLFFCGTLFFQNLLINNKIEVAEKANATLTKAIDKKNNVVIEDTKLKIKFKTKSIASSKKRFDKLLKTEKENLFTQNNAVLDKLVNDNLVIPAAFTENNFSFKINVSEQQSGTKNTTLKIYTVYFKNGQWHILPQWVLAAKEIVADSVLQKADSSLIKNQQEILDQQ